MEFTKKIKSLVNFKQISKSSLDDLESYDNDEALPFPEKEFNNKSLNDPTIDQRILDSIESVFYSDDCFDVCGYKLKNIPDSPDVNEINTDAQTHIKQVNVVSKKLSNLILQNQSSLADELQRVTEMQKTLEEACAVCIQSRSYLAQTKRDFTTASLGILASYRKREQFKSLLRSLHLIKTLQETDVRLRQLLEQENYPGAIQLCLECQKAANTFRHFACISELSVKLQDTLVMAEEQLDVALSKVCCGFSALQYEKLQAAYGLLGKTQTAVDQLLMHFASAIHNAAFTVVLRFAEKDSAGNTGSLRKRQYSELCKLTDPSQFVPCLEELCRSMWRIMYSYWCILQWHKENKIPNAGGESFDEGGYIRSKLEHGPSKVWQDVQQKVRAFLLGCDLTPCTFDHFIRTLAIVRRLVDVGVDFCGSASEELQEAVRKQSVNFFRNYHRGFMEELKTFLENEMWTICPVNPAFSTVHLQEFRFLKCSGSKSFSHSPDGSDNLSSPTDSRAFFTRYDIENSPFEDKSYDAEKADGTLEKEEDIDRGRYESDSDDSEIPDELKQDFIDETVDDSPKKVPSSLNKKLTSSMRKKNVPILTNTALNVLRSFGKYMQMMTALKPIAFDVLIYMTQLFDYYMYAVYIFFAKSMSDLVETSLSNKLKTSLKRIRDNQLTDEAESYDTRHRDKIQPPTLSSAVNLKNAEDMFGLAERVAAAESLVFLSEQFEVLYPHLEVLIPPAKRAYLQQFCSQTVSPASDLRRPIYMAVSASSIDYDQVVQLMANVKWDIEEIMSQHSPYVDILLRELQVFSMRLSGVSKGVPLPKESRDLLWEQCVRMSNRAFIEGFSRVRHCTNGGRALMQLDYQQFVTRAEVVAGIQPLPQKDLVEGYVKAYYMTEEGLEQFVRSHKDYTNKQLIALVNCVNHLNKKERQRLISLIEEGDKPKR